ncbi:hypothetical protein V6x_51020 [Gimesia chilikensis]|uniref:Uncharacterized protein n=1 Tax=Gimesia chilikensis TaxID=2605989 RepID=A0A517WJF1_9PLAN|nr:hypothetical protein [Gimesia chilikensis]QDU05366.1 hypothetical protein V6x_51020 [Gimesia chilikensis]
MEVLDDTEVTLLREDQLSLGIVLVQLMKSMGVSLYLTCWMSLRLLGSFFGLVAVGLLITGLVAGVIPLPGNLGEAWKVLRFVLIVIGGSTLLLSLFSLFAILVVPPVAFEKERVLNGSSSIDVKQITGLKISESAMSRILTLCYELDGHTTELPLHLVRNAATQQKLGSIQAWCAAREIRFEVE